MVWALVAASGLFWALRLFVVPAPVPPRTTVASNAPAVGGDLTRLFGVDAPPPTPQAAVESPAESRFQLIGVVAAQPRGAAREGVALIAVDGKAPKAFRVGAVVEGQTILKSVAARGATLGTRDGATPVNLTLNPLPPAATGTLPGAEGAEPQMAPNLPQAGLAMSGANPAMRLPQQPFQAGQAMGPQTPPNYVPPAVRRVMPPPQALPQPAQALEAPPQEVNNMPMGSPTR